MIINQSYKYLSGNAGREVEHDSIFLLKGEEDLKTNSE
jgi:hypothetical protein